MAHKGITEKILSDGSKNIYVRFKYQGVTYPLKNFTKHFGCKTPTKAKEKLDAIKVDIARGRDPFATTYNTLNEIFEERVRQKVRSGQWTHSTPTNYTYFYNKHIRKAIGSKKIEKITYAHLKKMQDDILDVKDSTKNTLKMILRPIFTEEVKKGNIHRNIIDDLETYNMPVKEKLDLRTSEKNIDIARKLYNAIPKYNALQKTQQTEVRMFLYLVLLTAHRFGELVKLKRDDCYIDKKIIISPASITKTKEDYKFPIPKEVIEYIKGIESGLLFPTIKRGSIYAIFQRVVQSADIELYKDKRISLHDTRRLMLTIMIRNLKIDSVLADSCLNHKQRGVINHYLSFDDDDIKKAYKKYWKFIRKTK
ncbi:tyrosine-type recombinase/integrase [Sulfurimonas sp. CS5]|uniref:tyrosine-type recombinase/integrase n=1 Tax=Sulfurimonas sp. CS5 TaxID=3391145 RepID=UPI0039EA8965